MRSSRSVSTPAAFMPSTSVSWNPSDALHGEHAAAHEVVVDDGHAGVGDLLVDEDPPHPLHVVGLEAEVHLLVERAGEVLGEGTGRAHRRLRDALEDLAHQQQRAELVAHLLVEPGTLHLDDHLGAVEQRGAVDLADGCGGEWLLLEGGERRAERSAEVLLDDRSGGGAGEGRHSVAQRRELRGPVRGEEPGARRDHLTHLHEGRAELDEGVAEPPREGLRGACQVAGEGGADGARAPGDASSAMSSGHVGTLFDGRRAASPPVRFLTRGSSHTAPVRGPPGAPIATVTTSAGTSAPPATGSTRSGWVLLRRADAHPAPGPGHRHHRRLGVDGVQGQHPAPGAGRDRPGHHPEGPAEDHRVGADHRRRRRDLGAAHRVAPLLGLPRGALERGGPPAPHVRPPAAAALRLPRRHADRSADEPRQHRPAADRELRGDDPAHRGQPRHRPRHRPSSCSASTWCWPSSRWAACRCSTCSRSASPPSCTRP